MIQLDQLPPALVFSIPDIAVFLELQERETRNKAKRHNWQTTGERVQGGGDKFDIETIRFYKSDEKNEEARKKIKGKIKDAVDKTRDAVEAAAIAKNIAKIRAQELQDRLTGVVADERLTVAAMIGLIIIAIVAFLPALGNTFSWGSFAGRVFISLTFGVLAAYAASQADKYQKVERQNRRLALELEAIGPFIAPLTTEKQEEFRMTIGERSFGHGDGTHGGIDSKSPATLVDVLLQSKESKEFRTLLTEIIKALK